MKPSARGIGADDSDTVGVVEKLHQPWHVPVPASERRVHEHQSMPWLPETIVLDGVDFSRGHPVTGTRRARIQIKDQAERLEVFRRRVPIGGRADAGLMLGHNPPFKDQSRRWDRRARSMAR